MESGVCGDLEAFLGSSPDPAAAVGGCAVLASSLRNGTLPITTGISMIFEGKEHNEARLTDRTIRWDISIILLLKPRMIDLGISGLADFVSDVNIDTGTL